MLWRQRVNPNVFMYSNTKDIYSLTNRLNTNVLRSMTTKKGLLELRFKHPHTPICALAIYTGKPSASINASMHVWGQTVLIPYLLPWNEWEKSTADSHSVLLPSSAYPLSAPCRLSHTSCVQLPWRRSSMLIKGKAVKQWLDFFVSKWATGLS